MAIEARKGKVDMGCQSCRTRTVQAGVTWRQVKIQWTWGVSCAGRTVQAGVTWRPGKVKWTWGVSRAGQGQFRLE